VGADKEKGELRSLAVRAEGSGVLLTHPMRDMLWTLAQHKYGWTHVSRHGGQLQVADGLVRRDLAYWSDEAHRNRNSYSPILIATPAGKAEIARRWPVSPFALGTYSPQLGGWTPVEGEAA
jgi:hypothetical protein